MARRTEICAPCEVWKGPGVSKGCLSYFISIFRGENGEFRDLPSVCRTSAKKLSRRIVSDMHL
jgi:hypothetical protein